MTADDLAPCVARSSADMVLTMQGNQILVFHKEGQYYRKSSNISRTLVGNKIVDRCSWSIACQRCSDYIFILNLAPGFNGLGRDNCKARQETLKFGDLVRLILEVLW